jgi:hypothetical protein
MSLDKASLKTALEAAFGASQVSDAAAKASIKQMAQDVADAVDTFVKSGTVNIPSTGAPGTPSTGSVS